MSEVLDRAKVFGERPGAVERIAPGFCGFALEADHVARYRWAARWVKDCTVLDVASGTGYGSRILCAGGARAVLSLDLSEHALRFARVHYGVVGIRTDAQMLPVATEACDAVVSLETIEHLVDPGEFVRETWRVLRPGGVLLLSTPNAARSSGTNPYHINEMCLEQLERLLRGAGFCMAGVWGQHWGLAPGPWHRIWGVRRFLWEVERRPSARRWRVPGLRPIYWCVRATKVNRRGAS